MLRNSEMVGEMYPQRPVANSPALLADSANSIRGVAVRMPANRRSKSFHGASETANKIAAKVADNIARKLPQKALNKSVINPLFGKILSKIGSKASAQSFADLFASAVPVLGAAFSGGLTYVTFMPRCYKLRNTLRKYRLCDPDFYTKES